MNTVVTTLKKATKEETQATLSVLDEIIELERTEKYKEHGYTALYPILTNHLQYSEGAAMRRLQAARVIAKYPEARELFLSRRVSLCTLSAIATRVLKADSDALLIAIVGKSKKEVEALLCKTENGGGKKREQIRPVKRHNPKPLTSAGGGSLFAAATHVEATATVEATSQVEQRFSLHFSITEEDRDLIDEARTALSSRYPKGAGLEELFVEGLRSILKEKERKCKSLGSRKSKRNDTSKRTATAKQQKEVLERDEHCCSFVYKDGTRCGSKWQLEIDHIKPFSLGGQTETGNLRVLCRAHNQYLGKQIKHT